MSELMYAGQFEVGAIEILQPIGSKGYAIDIRDQVSMVTLYEDIFSPFSSGNLVCLDSIDLPSYLLNGGADVLRLRLMTPGMKDPKTWIDKYFHIYKLSDFVKIGDRNQTYIYHFNSTDSMLDTSFNISKTFKDRGDNNIQDILKNMGSTRSVNSDVPINRVIYTSNYWSPTKNIAYNCDHSLAPDGTPSYVFFENRYGYQFKAMTTIAKGPVMQNFSASDYIADVKRTDSYNAGSTSTDPDKDFKLLLDIKYEEAFDYEKDKLNGMMSSRMFTFDPITKKLIDRTFNMNEDKHTLMNPNRFYTPGVIDASYKGSESATMLQIQKHTRLYDYDGADDVSDFNYKQLRISMMRQYQQSKIEITVLGRTDYTVGMVVTLDVNRLRMITKDLSTGEIKNPLITGKYIVSAICHRFKREGKHEITLELIRDSIGPKI